MPPGADVSHRAFLLGLFPLSNERLGKSKPATSIFWFLTMSSPVRGSLELAMCDGIC